LSFARYFKFSVYFIFLFYRAWLDKHPEQLRAVVVTFLRLMEDHIHPALTQLRNREAAFTVSIIRDRFAQCMVIGRDFVRLLQNVARIPDIEKLWKDILHNPRSLCPNFTGKSSKFFFFFFFLFL